MDNLLIIAITPQMLFMPLMLAEAIWLAELLK